MSTDTSRPVFRKAARGLWPLLLVAIAHPDDGALSAGGSPGLVQGHPTVAMLRERVVVTIQGDKTSVDCSFVFRNTGAACNVRMGFPDIADGANGADYSERFEAAKQNGRTLPPYEGLTSFASWVDGKRIKTKLIQGSGDVDSWHEKRVHFGTRQTRIVRDRYQVPAGIGATYGPGYLKETMYFMFTGASWHNKIGDVDILVRFPGSKRISAYHNSLESKLPKTVLHGKRTVLYDGFGVPKFGNNWIRFRAKNLKPTESDNVYIRYGWQPSP